MQVTLLLTLNRKLPPPFIQTLHKTWAVSRSSRLFTDWLCSKQTFHAGSVCRGLHIWRLIKKFFFLQTRRVLEHTDPCTICKADSQFSFIKRSLIKILWAITVPFKSGTKHLVIEVSSMFASHDLLYWASAYQNRVFTGIYWYNLKVSVTAIIFSSRLESKKKKRGQCWYVISTLRHALHLILKQWNFT